MKILCFVAIFLVVVASTEGGLLAKPFGGVGGNEIKQLVFYESLKPKLL